MWTRLLSIIAIATLAGVDLAVINSQTAFAKTRIAQTEADNNDLLFPVEELEAIARAITVKVVGNNGNGSGTIIARSQDNYLVLTSAKVVENSRSISIQTSDSVTYQARIVKKASFPQEDLAILEFTTNKDYLIPRLAKSAPKKGQTVVAAGYSEKSGITSNVGKIELIPSRSLLLGYQIGYSNKIEAGMSGGAIVNGSGEVIGINGVSQPQYLWSDRESPTSTEISQMKQLSWAVPIESFLAKLNPEIARNYSISTPQTTQTTQQTGWLGEIEAIAKNITVKIEDVNSRNNGSGVIIAKIGNTYYVLTCAHVLPNKNRSYEIVAPDGKRYLLDRNTINTDEGVDLAVVSFTSQENYQIATLSDYPTLDEQYIFAAGYPRINNSTPWRFSLGQTWSREQGIFETKDTTWLDDGYELAYTNLTFGGMSGGPVLDSEGRVIAIHGKAEAQLATDQKSGDREIIQLGLSAGIPIKTFVGIQDRLNINNSWIKVAQNKPSEITAQQEKSIIEAMLAVIPDSRTNRPSQWIVRGNQLWRLIRFDEAIKSYEEAIKLNPDFVYLAWYGKGRVLLELGKLEEALASFEQATNNNPKFFQAWQWQSRLFIEFKQYDRALLAIDKAIQIEPNSAVLYNLKNSILQDLKRYSEAELAANKAIKISPRAAFYNNRGVLYRNQKQPQLALADLNKAIQINPNYDSAYSNRGVLYSDQKKWQLALADFNKAIEINPNNALAYSNRGNLYSNQNKPELALADFNKAIAIDPNYAGTYNNRGNLYSNQNQLELALADYNKAIEIDPKEALFYNNRGSVYYNQNQLELALADYNKTLQIDPNYAKAYNNRGVLYYKQKKWELALADYNKAIEIDPNLADAYNNRGSVYYNQNQLKLALADFNKAIEIDPNLAEAYYNRGLLYYKQKKWELALADYNKTLQIDPNYAKAYYNRGLLYRNQNQLELAIADYNKAIEIDPNYVSPYNNRGNLYSNQNKPELALADFNKAIEIDPNLAEAYYNRGLLYFNQNQLELALADYNKTLQINPNNAGVYLNRAVLYSKQNKWQLALADYNKTLQINPNDAKAYYNRGLTWILLENKQNAIKDFQTAAQLFRQQNNMGGYQAVMSVLKELEN